MLLIRDPRDIIASYLDAFREQSWGSKLLFLGKEGERKKPEDDLDGFVRERTRAYAQDIGKAKEAYDSHEGPRTLVRYEDLLTGTLGEMERLCSELGLAVNKEETVRVVEQHSWQNIPEEKRGEGKFYRKATPGGWREDLTPEQVEIIGEITTPILEEFYP